MARHGVRTRLGLAVGGCSWLVRNAGAAVRLGAAAGRGDGWSAGKLLGGALPTAARQEAAAAMLREDHVAVDLEAGGFSWLIPSGDRILAEMLRGELYEDVERRAVVDWVRADERLRDRTVVVEVGANVGTTTVPLCASGFTVLAIEPVRETYRILVENLRRNDVDGSVRLANVACTAVEQVVEMRVSSGGSEVVTAATSETSGSSSIDRDEYVDGRIYDEVESVQGRPLDAIVGDAEVDPADVAFVWTDTEGHEAEVIGSGDRLWAAGVPAWTELWPAGLEVHSGIDRFCELAGERFGSAILGPDLCADGRAARGLPIPELRDLLQERLVDKPSWWSTDALLVPHG